MAFWQGVRDFFATSTLSPHGICLLWRPELIWTHAISDILIGLAYFSIPLALGVFLHHRRDVRFSWAVWMFVAFIVLCGVTHFLMVWTLWHPDYAIEALVKAATAAVSLVTAIALWPLLPKAIALPSTARLEASLAERDVALAELRAAMATMMEMREHEARQKLLLDELNHRVKNTLTSVQSVAMQSLHDSQDVAQARELFINRLMALSSAHNILVKHHWVSGEFHELVDVTLRPYGQPYTISGPSVRLSPNLVISLGMALHELATNALKYGAWSGGGRVQIDVDTPTPDRLQIVWLERGASRPVTPPSSKGFGTRLLERGIATELRGRVTLAFEPEGLICTIDAPISDGLSVVVAEAA